jgi:RNA polymerase-interacting CarD/CdnL/TRCF family regulator
MDMQGPTEVSPPEFTPGSSVIYAMHGRCSVLGTEIRSLGGESIRFYKLEVKKSALSRSNRHEPAIWVPVATAKDRGLRTPMSKDEAGEAIKVLMSREYFFKPSDPWTVVQPQLENTIRLEGGVGLAKVASFLFVLKRKQIVPSPEVSKLQEMIHKLLFRELSEALGQPSRILEEKVNKGFRSKLLPDM